MLYSFSVTSFVRTQTQPLMISELKRKKRYGSKNILSQRSESPTVNDPTNIRALMAGMWNRNKTSKTFPRPTSGLSPTKMTSFMFALDERTCSQPDPNTVESYDGSTSLKEFVPQSAAYSRQPQIA